MADPKPNEKIPGTDYIRCETDCKKGNAPGGAKKQCTTAGTIHPCTPNTPGTDPDRCHCLPFKEKDDGDWEVVQRDSTGAFDDDDKIKCFCVRKKIKLRHK
jgi:hypothetical protein